MSNEIEIKKIKIKTYKYLKYRRPSEIKKEKKGQFRGNSEP